MTCISLVSLISRRSPTPFSLLSFNAFVSPPYSDLFDFDWSLDGQRIPESLRETMQVAVPDFRWAGGNHRVEVTARGVRPYPDRISAFRARALPHSQWSAPSRLPNGQ